MDEQPRPRPVDLKIDWVGLGFDPDRERFEYVGAFTLTQAWRSLSETRRSVLVAVTMRNDLDRDAPVISFVIDKAQALHTFVEVEFNHSEQDSLEMPDWYFEGSVVAPRAVRDQRIRIHVSALYDDLGDSDIFSWQLFDAE